MSQRQLFLNLEQRSEPALFFEFFHYRVVYQIFRFEAPIFSLPAPRSRMSFESRQRLHSIRSPAQHAQKQSPIPKVVGLQACYSSSASKAALRRRWRTACAKDSKTARLSSHPAHASVMLTPYIKGLPASKSCRPAFK